MKKNTQVELNINTEWCKGCGICVAFCPKQVLELNRQDKSEVARLNNCSACKMCELRCPDLAIEVFTTQKKRDTEHVNPER
jgi:2-oxoglutarate ferredoxin oxidoreductase subunit delta